MFQQKCVWNKTFLGLQIILWNDCNPDDFVWISDIYWNKNSWTEYHPLPPFAGIHLILY